MDVTDELEPIVVASSNFKLSNRDIIMGKRFDPAEQLKIYSPADYENFITEWASAYLSKSYARVFRSKGAGDKGRDVIGFLTKEPGSSWDNYQCKHYGNALTPTDVWIEFGKLIYYTFKKEFSVPNKYYFVAPHGVGNKLMDYLENPDALKKALRENWEKYCQKEITNQEEAPLSGDLLTYFEAFDFKIFSYLEPHGVITQHATTPWHEKRFGGGLKPRPKPPRAAPKDLHASELVYTEELQKAYSEREGQELDLQNISKHSEHGKHFERQRRFFYHAESLRQFAKDTLPENGDFEDLQEQILDGVIAVVESTHVDGLDCLNKTLVQSTLVPLSHVLQTAMTPADRGGICHQLVNEKKIKWVKDES